jgi:hypothetical protein
MPIADGANQSLEASKPLVPHESGLIGVGDKPKVGSAPPKILGIISRDREKMQNCYAVSNMHT